MKKKYNVAVIGATGSVGQEVLNILVSRKFPLKQVYAAASPQSVGKEVSFGNTTLQVMQVNDLNFSKIDIAFFCTNSTVSKKYIGHAIHNQCTVIDKSSYYRLNPEVPLVVPEANIHTIRNLQSRIIANPNCCTIPLAVVLKPLDNVAQIRRVIISTYQSVSGSGKSGMDELYQQTKRKFIFEHLNPQVFPTQIAFNLFPHIGEFRADDYTEEEHKITEELKKILGKHVNPTVTCVRVPVFVSHSMSVNIEFQNNITAREAEEILADTDGIISYNIKNEIQYATPIDVVENEEVFVSRIRDDKSCKNALNLWVCSDNLRKGAALNAIQIAEELIRYNEL